MINYRLSAAASVDYVMQTSVQTHIHFIDAAFSIFPAVSFQFMPTSLLLSIAHNIILHRLEYFCMKNFLLLRVPLAKKITSVFRKLSPIVPLALSNQGKKE